MQQEPKLLDLMDLKRGDHFKLAEENPRVPPSAYQPVEGATYVFHNIDGMYSLSFLANTPGSPYFHFAAWTKVYKV